MTSLPVTSLAAALLGLLLFVLTVRVILVRRSAQVSLGSGGNRQLEKRIRSQGNFCELAPFCLILLGLAEAQGALAGAALQGLAGLLVLARAAHPFGIEAGIMPARILGMVGTFVVLVAASLALLLRNLPI